MSANPDQRQRIGTLPTIDGEGGGASALDKLKRNRLAIPLLNRVGAGVAPGEPIPETLLEDLLAEIRRRLRDPVRVLGPCDSFAPREECSAR